MIMIIVVMMSAFGVVPKIVYKTLKPRKLEEGMCNCIQREALLGTNFAVSKIFSSQAYLLMKYAITAVNDVIMN
jgi:hypothetical protein